MYVRDARNRDEAWMLDHIERLGLDGAAFRSRDYVIAVDEETNERAGFGRIRIHKLGNGEEACELTGLGVLEDWRRQGVGAHIVERLVENARDGGFEHLYAFVDEPRYLRQFGFEEIDTNELPDRLTERLAEKREGLMPDAVPVRLEVAEFRMPAHLREAFKQAAGDATPRGDGDDEDRPEDFGIDPETATYKYDTGR